MNPRLVACSECGLQVTITPQTVQGVGPEFYALCKHQNEDNGGYRCRVLQQAIDQVRSKIHG